MDNLRALIELCTPEFRLLWASLSVCGGVDSFVAIAEWRIRGVHGVLTVLIDSERRRGRAIAKITLLWCGSLNGKSW